MIGKPEWLAGDLDAHLPVVSVDYHDREIARLTKERDDLREALKGLLSEVEDMLGPVDALAPADDRLADQPTIVKARKALLDEG